MVDKKEDEVPIFSGSDSEWIDASYQVTPRETQWIQNLILKVNRQKAVAQKRIPTKNIPNGTKKYTVETISEVTEPKFTDNFLKEDQMPIVKAEADFYLAFMHHDYRIAMTDAHAVANSQFHSQTLPDQTISALTASIADYREKVVWRGYDIAGRANLLAANQGVIDTNVLGIINTVGINTFTAGAGGDGSITAPGDGHASIAFAASSLITDGYYGPYDVYMTPEVWAKLLRNQNSTTGFSDLHMMSTLTDINGGKMIKSMNVTKHLLPTVEASASEANMVVIDPKDPQGAPTVVILEGYALSNLAHSPEAAVASKGKIIWSGCAAVLRPEAVTWEENITYA